MENYVRLPESQIVWAVKFAPTNPGRGISH
jgi:hypothetical protein